MAQRKNSGRTQQRTAFRENRNASATKAGPGRFHTSSHRKASPVPRKGAGVGFDLHEASTEKKLRREEVRTRGLRQVKRESYLKHEGYAERHPTIAARYEF